MVKKYLVGSAIAFALLPGIALAQSTTDIQSQIQALLSQIQALQQQLHTLVASSTHADAAGPWMMGSTTPTGIPPGQAGKAACITLTRNLAIGSHGDDVKSLQQLLGEDPQNGFTASATGFFGPLTAHAMMLFQMRMGIASTTTGTVGPLTRGFFQRHCGDGLGNGQGGEGDMMQGRLTGTISALSATSITLENDGKSIVVNITASTSIQVFAGTSTPPTVGSVSDLTVGQRAAADGPRNQDGSMQAVHIMVGQLPPPPMQDGEGHGPSGMMPIRGGTSTGSGLNGEGPQNW